MMELLVGAGSPEAVTAAVQNGADAIYLSFDELTDCRRAENFSDGGFEAAVRYCRVRGCRVYLALNATVRDEEMQKAGGLALRAQRAGVDAVILRDLGVYAVVRRLLPDMPLFADAHMGFFTPESAAVAASLGFRRIFLPPEMPLEQIRRMAAAPVETAVYAQTSLCAAACGTCRMSAMAGQGSEDRGLCSRLCRENYTFGGRWDTTPLSWKDRSLLPDVPALEEAGVTCLCLGDRDRRPEYAAAYTRVFAAAIREKAQPAPMDLAAMEEAFAPYGVQKKEIYEPAEPHTPEPRTQERYLAEIRRSYTETEERRVGVSFAVVANSETGPIHLGAQDEEKNTAVIEGPAPDPLGDVELTEEVLTEAMYRTAGTPFRCTDVHSVTKEGLRVSGIELDAARRRLLYKLSEERARPPEWKEGTFPAEPGTRSFSALPVVNFAFQSAGQMTAEMAALRPACVYAPRELLADSPAAARPSGQGGGGRGHPGSRREPGPGRAGRAGGDEAPGRPGSGGDQRLCPPEPGRGGLPVRLSVAGADPGADPVHGKAGGHGAGDLRPAAGNGVGDLPYQGQRRALHLHHPRPDGRHPGRRVAGDEAFRLPEHRVGRPEAVAGRRHCRLDPQRALGRPAELFHREPLGVPGGSQQLHPRHRLPAQRNDERTVLPWRTVTDPSSWPPHPPGGGSCWGASASPSG